MSKVTLKSIAAASTVAELFQLALQANPALLAAHVEESHAAALQEVAPKLRGFPKPGTDSFACWDAMRIAMENLDHNGDAGQLKLVRKWIKPVLVEQGIHPTTVSCQLNHATKYLLSM